LRLIQDIAALLRGKLSQLARSKYATFDIVFTANRACNAHATSYERDSFYDGTADRTVHECFGLQCLRLPKKQHSTALASSVSGTCRRKSRWSPMEHNPTLDGDLEALLKGIGAELRKRHANVLHEAMPDSITELLTRLDQQTEHPD
jgi:hypothetical protein